MIPRILIVSDVSDARSKGLAARLERRGAVPPGEHGGRRRRQPSVFAQQLRAKVAKSPVRGPKGAVNVTVSVGAAWAPASQLRTSGALLDAADDALCWAQLRGGNRVEVRAA